MDIDVGPDALRDQVGHSFRSLAAIAGWSTAPAGNAIDVGGHRLQFVNCDPLLPTPFRIGATSAAALGAVGVAAAKLWDRRGGRGQELCVDQLAAAASCRGTRYLLLDGKPPDGDPWSKLTGFYRTRESQWVYLQCNYPHHALAAADALGVVEPTRQAFIEASAVWDAASLEQAVIEGGGCAGLVRSSSEWHRHPQAQTVAALPVVEITKIGDSPAEALPRAGSRPLSGVRVLDLTRVLAGPTCGRTLAEHGADVLRISAPHHPNSGLVEIETALGKLSAFLDLNEASQFDRLSTLLRDADIISQSSRPGSIARKGLSPQRAAEIRPGIIYLSLSAFSHAGPWRNRRGFDSVVQAVSGMAFMTGAGIEPMLTAFSAIDYIAGYLLAFGAMVALERRAETGGSYLVRTSLAQAGHWILAAGLVSPKLWAGLDADLSEAVVARLTEERHTVMGTLRHLRPVISMSETPPGWERPPTPLGAHPPAWPV